MKTIITVIALGILTSCSGVRTKLNTEEHTQILSLLTRCEIEYAEILKGNDAVIGKFCDYYIQELADYQTLQKEGTVKALEILNRNYKIALDINRALVSEDQDRIDRFSKEIVLATARGTDKCLDKAKSFYYEKEMAQRVKDRMAVKGGQYE